MTALDCPRVSAQFLDDEKRALGPYWFAQEYMCEFGDTSHQVFGHDLIMAALDDTVRPLAIGRRRAA